MSSDLAHLSLQGADLQGLIAARGAGLQLPKDVSTAPFRIGHPSGDDELPLSYKGVQVGAPPTSHSFSLLPLSVQGLKS